MINGILPVLWAATASAGTKASAAVSSSSFLGYIEGLVAFMVILGILVFVHEFGHFAAAKLAGIRVDEFAFGFGPRKIVLFRKGDTEYTIHPFPLGGFVKLAGMEPGEDQDVAGGFNTKPILARMAVILAGPGMNIVLALVVFTLMGFTVGTPGGVVVGEVRPHSEATRVGLQKGDVITEIDGRAMLFPTEAIDVIHNSMGKPLQITVARGESIHKYTVTPQPVVLQKGMKPVGIIGFSPSAEVVFRKNTVIGSIGSGMRYTYGTTKMMVSTIFGRIGGAAVGKVPVSEVKREVGGPIAIFFVIKGSVEKGVGMLALLIALLSVNLGVVNVLPIPVLDGGHLLLLTIEGIRRKRLSPEKQAVFQWIGLSIILMLMVLIFYNDISRIPDFIGR